MRVCDDQREEVALRDRQAESFAAMVRELRPY